MEREKIEKDIEALKAKMLRKLCNKAYKLDWAKIDSLIKGVKIDAYTISFKNTTLEIEKISKDRFVLKIRDSAGFITDEIYEIENSNLLKEIHRQAAEMVEAWSQETIKQKKATYTNILEELECL